nr:ABC transporter ATP-binding protein [Heliorestis acidaminivorans]
MLEVNNLSLSFTQYQRGLKQKNIQVISDLSLSIQEGEILAVVGSSGSGKSLLAHAILGILPKNASLSGRLYYGGQELTAKRQKELRGKEIAFIPQSVNFLDPLMQIGQQVRTSSQVGSEKGIAKGKGGEKEKDRDRDREKGRVKDRAKDKGREKQRKIFDRYELDYDVENYYPFQISGGMARRVLVASAVVGGPKLIIADEPTPGLHHEVVKEALGHLRELADEGTAIMLITHDIATALEVADRIAVFYAGTIVEIAWASEFTDHGDKLRHPYTKALWMALPQNGFLPILGRQPSPSEPPPGCLFQPRCSLSSKSSSTNNSSCSQEAPVMRELRSGKVRCHFAT